jgi:plastocyanin
MHSRSTTSAILLTAALTLSGCKPDAALKDAQMIGRGTPASTSSSQSADAGSVEGTIHFTGTAPERTRIDLSMDPACSMDKSENDAEQFVVNDGGLANVYVYIKAGAAPSQAAANSTPVVLDQKGCRYTPHVIALQQGGTVEFRNSDPTMHTTHTMTTRVGNKGVDIAQGPGAKPQTRQFTQPEAMIPVLCPIHPWMNAFINVADTPYFAISGTDGHFNIQGLPPGHYTLAAVHEKLGEQDLEISIPPKSTATADFTFAIK